MALVGAHASTAAAQPPTAIVTRPAGDATGPIPAEVTDAVALELRRLGVRVRMRNLQMPRECGVSCLAEVAQQYRATIVVGIGVWVPGPRRETGQLNVTLTDERGHDVHGESGFEPGDHASAASEATRIAHRRWPNRRGATVRVDVRPPDATLMLDGRVSDTLPFQGRLTTGPHELVAFKDGYRSERRHLEVSGDEAELEERFELRPDPGAAGPAPAELEPSPARRAEPADPATGARPTRPTYVVHDRGSWLNWLLTGALAAGGAALAASGLYTAATDGRCLGRRDQAGHCDDEVTFGAPAALSLGAGIALLGAGALFAIAQPIRVDVEVVRTRAEAHLSLDIDL